MQRELSFTIQHNDKKKISADAEVVCLPFKCFTEQTFRKLLCRLNGQALTDTSERRYKCGACYLLKTVKLEFQEDGVRVLFRYRSLCQGGKLKKAYFRKKKWSDTAGFIIADIENTLDFIKEKIHEM